MDCSHKRRYDDFYLGYLKITKGVFILVLKVGDRFHLVGTGLQRYPRYRDDILTVESVSSSHAQNPAYDDYVVGVPMYSADGGRINVYDWEAEYIDPDDIEVIGGDDPEEIPDDNNPPPDDPPYDPNDPKYVQQNFPEIITHLSVLGYESPKYGKLVDNPNFRKLIEFSGVNLSN